MPTKSRPRVETLMAGHAARRWILEVRLDRRVDEVFLARFWKKDIQSAFRKRDKNRRYGMRPSSNDPRWREAIKQLPTHCRLLTDNQRIGLMHSKAPCCRKDTIYMLHL
jgi:hypothetical protein